MPLNMRWLVVVVRLAVTPVLLGALLLWLASPPSVHNKAAGLGLLLLGTTHLLYWWRPWPPRWRRTVAAAGAMLVTNAALIHLLGLSQPLLWLYPALVIG